MKTSKFGIPYSDDELRVNGTERSATMWIGLWTGRQKNRGHSPFHVLK